MGGEGLCCTLSDRSDIKIIHMDVLVGYCLSFLFCHDPCFA
jgi:hypothetical protein